MNKTHSSSRTRPKYAAWTAGVLLLAAAGLFGFTFFGAGSDASISLPSPASVPRQDEGTIRLSLEQRAHVLAQPVQEEDWPLRTTVPGRVDFNQNRITPLFAQFSGRVVHLDGEVGQAVRQGQHLGMLDSPDIVEIQAACQHAYAEHQQALASLLSAQASLDLAVRTRERAQRLAAVEAISLRELQQAEVDEAHAEHELQWAEFAVAGFQSALTAARGRLRIAGFSDSEIEALQEGPLAIRRLAPLTAPVGGTIIARNVGLGQVIPAGGDVLFKIADLSTVWFHADVYEDQLASIQPGAPVSIRISAYPSENFSARVDWIGATVDPDKRTVAVRCVLGNRDGRLRPGMFATAVLQSSTRRALRVPASAVVDAGSARTVFLETEPGTFHKRVVETGDELAGAVEVRSGLRAGERVVVQGSLLLARQLAEARSIR